MKKIILSFLLLLFAASAQAQDSLSFNHETLIIKNDSISIGGTLTWPKNQSTDQLIITDGGHLGGGLHLP